MKLDVPHPRRRARVEMIPLIDCVFILLIFFIYSMLAMTLQRGIIVQLPEARSLQTTQEESVVVTITAGGELLVDKQAVSLEELGPAVDNARDLVGGPRLPRVIVNADAESEHRWFVQVIDELKRRGISRIVILSQEPSTP